MNKIILYGKSEEELKDYFNSIKYPHFHGSQLYEWFYNKSIISFDKMTNLPKSVKNILNINTNSKLLKINKSFESNIDNTKKFLLETNDSKLIECVSMQHDQRHTVCISSQIGCNVNCSFCATGKMGIIRNLNIGEILQQLHIILEQVKSPITNIVFMGMGEPFLNYTNVLNACKILNDPKGFNISSKKITISTSGILPQIKKFVKDKEKYKLAISLNASNNELRNKLIPINKKWPIESLIYELRKYKFKKYRPIMFEYVLMENINDTENDAKALSEILKDFNCKVNIIPYNSISKEYKRPEIEKINNFVAALNRTNNNFKTFIRWSKGIDINAACGQLATENGS